MPERITVHLENQVARVQLNRPDKRNALDLDMYTAIAACQKRLAKNRDLRAVVLSGAGVDFCSGLDVKAMMQNRRNLRKLLWKWLPWRANLAQVVSVGWRSLPVPVIAAVHGRCWGGGLQIALGADFRIVQPDATLSVMEGKWGLIPDMGGTLALRELTARDHAMWLSMSAEEFGARRALDLGLATAIADDAIATAGEMASQLRERSPDAVAAVKRLLRKSWTGSTGTALARETGYQLRILSGDNQRIAVRRQLGESLAFRPAGRW